MMAPSNQMEVFFMKRLLFLMTAATALSFANDSLVPLLSAEEIEVQIQKAAQQINHDYAGKELKIVMLMKGALTVTADLIRHLEIPFTIEYIKTSSYGKNGTTRGELTIKGLESLQIENQDVLIVDDIFDTGFTMKGVIDSFHQMNPKSLKSLVLLVKKVERSISYRPDYVLFDIDNHFVVGYGLDYKEYYRGLPGIFYFKGDRPPENLN